MSDQSDKLKILFVCLGNICRSPLAEGVFRHFVREAGLEESFHIDSAGTSSYHAGDPPDERTASVARARGIELESTSRGLLHEDLHAFDYLIVMDEDNRAGVERLARREAPRAAVHLLREFDPEAKGDLNVPDPYYGGPRGFEHVHDIVDRSCRRLLEHLRKTHGL